MRRLRPRRSLFALLAVLAVATGSLAAPADAGPAAPDPPTVWLCRPGLTDDPCTPSLTTTHYDNEGNVLGVQRVKTARRPKVDCFYVYPTVSDQRTAQADFSIDPELRSIALFQAARYSSECRVFAPVYRQITLAAITGGASATPEMRETAYQDVRHAWLDYLAHDNHGRGVVFIGHSQGTGVLRRLLREEVDPVPSVRRRLVSALLLGGGVTVAKGSDRGGDFENIPACRSPKQLGCVVAYATFGGPVPAESGFGRTSDPDLEVLCTNPAALGGGSAPIDPINPTEPFAPGTIIAAAISLIGAPPTTATTPWTYVHDAYDARCISDGGANVLRITPLGAAPVLNPVPDATWGLHLVDANIALGDLVRLVDRQADRWTAHRHRPHRDHGPHRHGHHDHRHHDQRHHHG